MEAISLPADIIDDTQLFKMYWDNESFRRQLSDLVFRLTYERPAPGRQA